MKKRLLTAVLAGSMLGTVLTGCGAKSEASQGKGEDEKIVINYANWNLGTEEENNIERRMIAEYEKRNPNVKIKIAENIDNAQYVESLTTAAAAGNLPDVIMLQDIPTALGNEWLLDISEFTSKDEDWSKMAPSVIESTEFKDGTYSMPAGQYFLGYFINKDLFESENVKELEAGYTLEDFENTVKSLTSVSKGIIGLEDEGTMIDWYAAVKSDNLGWFSWDGEKYNLDSPEFKEGINKAKEFASNGYVYGALAPEDQQKFNGTNGYEVWKEGQVALKYEGTWGADGLKEFSFDSKFIGLPNSKTVIVNDYMGISNTTKHAEEAYDFAKWMTFSKEGTLERVKIADENDIAYASLPLINDQEVLDKYFEFNNIEGVREVYENLDNTVVEAFKVVPGYANSRWHATTGLKVGDKENISIGDLVFDCYRGNSKIEDFAAQLNDLANKQYEDASAAIK